MNDKFNILIVDDIQENIYTLELLISDNFDVNIYSALSASDAMKVLLEHPIDLILSDVQMPDINGFEFAQYLKDVEITKNIPIIFITGIFDKDEYKAKGYDVGAIEYITKPIDNTLLLSKLKIYIDVYNRLKIKNLELNKSNALLIQSSKMATIGEMLGVISHQLKQPLNLISLYCDDMHYSYKTDDLNDDFMNDFKVNTKEQINYMNKTINGFLEFFNPNKKKEKFNIHEAVIESTVLLKDKLKTIGTHLEYDIDESLNCYGVEMEISQVVLNIINNALDVFQEKSIENSLIEIKSFKSGDKIVLTIEDNAGGVENNQIESLFDAYYTTKEEGTGIGLYMAKLIVENSFNGKIEVKNSGKGLKFIIFLNSY
jgi:signal transduction histidine kinase